MPESGFLLIHKPSGPTSHDIVDAVRRVTGERTVGHAGTLDPFAEGLLIVGVGREATKRLDQFKNLPKTYIATLKFGATSDTDDRTGRIMNNELGIREVSGKQVNDVIKNFIGEIEQVPPMYSAKKIGGKKLYELARKGQTIERKPAKMAIYSTKLLDIQETEKLTHRQTVKLEVTCSAGTYIRALARDIGEKLGCGAYLEGLTRTAIGPFALKDAISLDKLNATNWQNHILTTSNNELGVMNKGSSAHNSKFIIHYSPPKPLRVLVFGTFDHLHPGHLDFFRQAKAIGDRLIVGVGCDNVVAAIKGKPPRQHEQVRLAAVCACGLADEALLLPRNPDERFDWIKKQAPDVIALGYDQTAFTETLGKELQEHAIACRVLRLQPHRPDIYKSSKKS
ncbi:tRNA pseudouridine(55) synthase TruB [Candidatus Uhrbacteria bacterium RIFCSPHIGHO2_12_FULL_54_23]|uniref:tRNA pseudouridine synthase B n=3 Tax=Candidatus Uhriibacteriota TaxID=1752732 RepID=A0A1F7UMJ4_9BACT|nr:MAG: tRNA pseudouridine(55) synthase TruB [Candidatus Uhrbacteria bacterium RIFCSPHIGHO2_12_FULL_54_23]OGL85562.1 MAG: tRNA pseudouridine(55) synthase TruB [Candidatus Uhrbacteria bacterium RIFCSPLOWO2_01_FULL_55_36]OGL90802.1 MAG: tRNA pseudouridine(55) synthase TruB [Candidatus Uhrbacteria bacterium RIFCSPLOWO2_02_FULL_54_37]